jgi:hypothetical protein
VFLMGRLLRNLVRVERLVRSSAEWICDMPEATSCWTNRTIPPDIASTSGSATPSLNLRMPAMPGRTHPLASPAPSVGPFEEEVRSLEDRRIEFSQRPIIFYGSSSIRLWKTLRRFYRVPGALL